MSGGHAHGLFLHADSPVHRLAPHTKLVALGAFVAAVVATPREATWAFALYGALLVAAAGAARVPLGFAARRLALEAPFVAFALLLPFSAAGPRVEVGPVDLSQAGLWGAWGVLSKATLGVGASIVVAATTPATDLLRGLETLRAPRALTAIAGFMVRYADVVTGEMRRMTIARRARGHEPRWLWDLGPVAASAGALFVRCFERGERVHHAMLARGFTGSMPASPQPRASAREWGTALALPALAASIAALALAA